jgi:diguanylate cyclase (GGDEF)-like protein
MHSLLQRQIRRYLGGVGESPATLEKFLAQVDLAYEQADKDRTRLERALDLSSNELNQRNAALKAQIVERERIEEQLRLSNARLAGWVERLELHNQQMSLLNKMVDMLQACQRLPEAYAVITDSLKQLFPRDVGSVALLDDAGKNYEVVAEWGEGGVACLPRFAPEHCWALRRARSHEADGGELGAACCAHLPATPTHGYVCVPLISQGRALGVLTLQSLDCAREGLSEDEHLTLREARRQLTQTASEHIGLAIVNIRLQETLRQQSVRDPLTGLFNRRHMEEYMSREMLRARRQRLPVTLMLIDVDHFKRFNDTHGHQAGDALLAGLGAFLQKQVRGEDIACRYGGEEFILILPGAATEIVLQRAESLRIGVADTLRIQHDNQMLPQVTLSIGVASFPADGNSSQECIGAADRALYRAKTLGRNRVVLAEAVADPCPASCP